MISERTVVDGRFELLEPLGSGGMGTVWRAYDLALHREVALKEVRAAEPDGGASLPDVQRERVLREARALARIAHPNVVTVHHIVDSDAAAHPWIVMELIRGRTLAEHLADGPMHPARAAQIGRGILAALRAAHVVGVLHRDIKPANVILREDGTPVLTDFGIAAITGLNGLTSTGSVVGSLDYVAPERLGGQEGNPASDLWSLGLVLYVAVEGYHPMRRDTTVATLAAVLKGEVPPPQRSGPLTPALQALLVPDPNHRPPPEQVDWMLAQATAPIGAGAAPLAHTHLPSVNAHTPAAQTHPPVVHTHAPSGQTHLPSDRFHVGSGHHPEASRHRQRWIVTGIVAAAIAAAIIVAVAVRPDSTTTQTIPSQTPGTSERPGTSRLPGATPSAAPVTEETADLLTPDGIRQAITALEKVTGGKEFTEATFYPSYANVGAPVTGQPKIYDVFTYRDGVGSRQRAGGQLSGKTTVNLGSINWDILPTLMRAAEDQLNIPAPTLRYVIVDPGWTFNDDRPTIMVYLTDDYGGAYLAADVDGTVVKVYARER
ncbi:serine/threonine-protein kinase [Nocardia sp. GCM10030253]|uniref:serine/threonine-protein kinase n=1 Tax=Nocardia sp. GCM10030253 TaxID=3273404 RepID=UPI0036286AD0